jgi:diketogulonate reductase-like aldo/keto reductase
MRDLTLRTGDAMPALGLGTWKITLSDLSVDYENLGAGDLTLSPDDMAAISGLNQNLRFNDPGQFCETAFNTFCPIFD